MRIDRAEEWLLNHFPLSRHLHLQTMAREGQNRHVLLVQLRQLSKKLAEFRPQRFQRRLLTDNLRGLESVKPQFFGQIADVSSA